MSLTGIEINPAIPENERINYWFPNKEIREELGIILGKINLVKDDDIRKFCLCAFSNILKRSIWLMKSIKPTRNLSKKPMQPLKLLSKQLSLMLKGNEELFRIMPDKVKRALTEYVIVNKGDARSLPCDPDSVNLIVTSPPYVTSYEYADLHQLTALWLGYTEDIAEFRENFIGSMKRKVFIHNNIKSMIAKNVVEQLSKKSRIESEAVKNYFFEMQQCFEEMYRVLKPTGKSCIVIGDTELRKIPILNAEIFVEIMLNIGFKIHKIVKRKVPSKILPQTRDSKTGRFASNNTADRLAYAYEYILIMEKPGAR